MTFSTLLNLGNAQKPGTVLSIWRQERAFRIGHALCYSCFLLSVIATVTDFFWSDFFVILTDFVLLFGVSTSLYFLRAKPRPGYFWWPLYIGFWISTIPSFLSTGGIQSPFFGLSLVVFYLLGAVLDANNSPFRYFLFSLSHIPAFLLIGQLHPIATPSDLPQIFTIIMTILFLVAIYICINAVLRTEEELSLEFANHYRHLGETEAALKKQESLLLEVHQDLEKRVEERTLQLEESLKREKIAKRIAEEASQAKMQFLANMSHEIRTPMNSILGFSDLLVGDHLSKDEMKEYLSRIRANGKQLLHLIDDILDLSKFEAGRIPIQKSSFSLRTLINEVVNSFAPSLAGKDLQLHVLFPEGPSPQIYTDPARMSQVLTNLLSNSVKFSSKGIIQIAIKYHKLDGNKLFVSIDVSDAGVGISEENQRTLFQPFSQGDSSVARRFGGSGLGLALSKHIAKALDGTLELVHSQPGVGSQFSFQLTVDQIEENPTVRQPVKSRAISAENNLLKNKKVLLVEDSSDNAFLIWHYLKAFSVEVDIANDGAEAVEKCQQKSYDCILMDIQMPGMDGLEATRKIRAQGFKKPIIALTAHALPTEAQRSLEAGCDLHLTKPISKDVLIGSLSTQLILTSDLESKIKSENFPSDANIFPLTTEL